MKKLYTLLSIILISASSQAQVVISQAYGGGGNTGATFTNDFIELFNGASSIDAVQFNPPSVILTAIVLSV